ncbi:MAG: hypothetical protein QXE79_01795 [Candidatus Bathyarchaeia archaeon]
MGRRGEILSLKGALYGIIAAIGVSFLLFFMIAVLKPSWLDSYTDYSVAILSFLPVASGFQLIRRYSFSSIFGKCFSFLTSASALWFLGEALWPIQTRVLGVGMPFPSVSDLLWMSGYIFFGFGLYTMFKMFNPATITGRKKFILILLLTLVASVFTLILTLQIYKGAPFIEQIIYTWYLVMDVVFLGLLSVIFQTFRGGKVSKAWLIMISGLAAIFLADILFNLATYMDSEVQLLSGDLIYMIGYSLMALSFIEHAIEL